MAASESDIVPPVAVARAAAKGLKLREQFKRGGTSVGLRRARQLVDRAAVSPRDITAISSYFKRHRVDQDSTSHAWGDAENPSAGYIAWLLWGGDAGEKWADAKKAKQQKATRTS